MRFEMIRDRRYLSDRVYHHYLNDVELNDVSVDIGLGIYEKVKNIILLCGNFSTKGRVKTEWVSHIKR